MLGRARPTIVVLALLLAAGCGSDGSRATPRPSPTPERCTASAPQGPQHLALRLASIGPRPLVRADRGTVVTVNVSYRNQTVQVPKVFGDHGVLCVLGGSTRPAQRVQVRYLAEDAGTVTLASGLTVATRADAPALFGTVRVR